MGRQSRKDILEMKKELVELVERVEAIREQEEICLEDLSETEFVGSLSIQRAEQVQRVLEEFRGESGSLIEKLTRAADWIG